MSSNGTSDRTQISPELEMYPDAYFVSVTNYDGWWGIRGRFRRWPTPRTGAAALFARDSEKIWRRIFETIPKAFEDDEYIYIYIVPTASAIIETRS